MLKKTVWLVLIGIFIGVLIWPPGIVISADEQGALGKFWEGKGLAKEAERIIAEKNWKNVETREMIIVGLYIIRNYLIELLIIIILLLAGFLFMIILNVRVLTRIRKENERSKTLSRGPHRIRD